VNPGLISSTFIVCILNIHPLLNPLTYTAISDLAETHNIYFFALTETWITLSATSAGLRNATPPGILLISNPRIIYAHVVGGGSAFLLHDSAVIFKSPPCPGFQSFELLSITLKLLYSKLTVYNVYRPPPATTKWITDVPLCRKSRLKS